MRITSEFQTQIKLGQVSMPSIKLDFNCRDDITKFLLGMQHISQQKESMDAIYVLLKDKIQPSHLGRSGMSFWRIIVLGLLRQILNGDYDRLRNLANNHKQLREVLGHGMVDADDLYCLQTIKDNIGCLTEELLKEINIIVAKTAHELVDKRITQQLHIKTDSFVVESNVHYPTDSSLLFDAMRCIIRKTAKLSHSNNVEGWRQSEYHVRHLKTLMRKATSLKTSTSKNQVKQEKRQLAVQQGYIKFITECQILLSKAQGSLELCTQKNSVAESEVESILKFRIHAERQIDQLYRRVILKEAIPHHEKVFSIFEEYTEWVCKGKAGVPVELGLKVCISSDQSGFILGHEVMQKQQDVDVATSMITKIQRSFANMYSASFDRGFYSKTNQEALEKQVQKLILPKKGKVSKSEKLKLQNDLEYQLLRRRHSAVESNINALEVHSLDRCPDRSIEHFKRYVAMAVVAHNIHNIGALVQAKRLKKERKRQQSIPIAA